MNSSLPSSEFIPHGCEVYEVMGGRLHQPSILTQAFLIIIIVVIILTSPVTAATNSLVMIAVKMKARLRVHKSNIALALLASTHLTIGVLVQPLYVALMRAIVLDGTWSAPCALQVLTESCAALASLPLWSTWLWSAGSGSSPWNARSRSWPSSRTRVYLLPQSWRGYFP